MAKMIYIYSTMSADNKINIFADGAEKGKKIIVGAVTIFGKANIANNKTLITPKGVLTTLEEETFNNIKENTHFKKWVNSGFISVETKKADDVDDVSKNMTKKDKSAQKVSEDLQGNKAEIIEG